MRNKSWKRKILVGLGLVAVVLVVLLITCPVWFPWVLPLVAKKYGASYATYERVGYERIALRDVRFVSANLRLEAKRVEAYVPTTWLWQRQFGQSAKPFLRAEDWQLTWREGKKNQQERSFHRLFTQSEAVFGKLSHWLPKALLTNGTIRFHKWNIGLDSAEWNRRALSVQGALPDFGQSATVMANLGAGGTCDLFLRSPGLKLESKIQLSENASGVSIVGTNYWGSNRIDLLAQFARTGWLPQAATLQAASFQIPARLLKLRGYQDLNGAFSARWQDDGFTLAVKAEAHPLEGKKGKQPPVEVTLRAKGNTESAQIQAAKIRAPGLRVDLSNEVKFDYSGRFSADPANLELSLDLAQQPWLPLAGTVQGRAILSGGTAQDAELSFTLSGSDIGDEQTKAKTVEIRGRFAWPWFQVTKMEVQFTDASKGSLSAKVNVDNGMISDGRLQFAGSFGPRFLPPGYSYQRASVEGEFSGPWQKVRHSARLEVADLTTPALHPMRLKARWQGDHFHVEDAEVVVAAGKSSVLLGGSIETHERRTAAVIRKLTLERGGQAVLELKKAAQVSFERMPTSVKGLATVWTLGLEGFHWSGKESEIILEGNLQWPNQGRLEGRARQVSSRLFADFIKQEQPEVQIHTFDFSGGWTNKPADFAIRFLGSIPGKEEGPFLANLHLDTSREGISLASMSVSNKSQSILSASGHLPLVLNPGQPQDLLSVLPEKPIRLQVITQPQSAFWEEVSAWAGWKLQKVDLKLNVAGRWESPQGLVDLRVEQIDLPKQEREMPPIKDLQVAVELNEKAARIKSFQMFVAQQPVSLTGEIPLSKDFWRGLAVKPTWPDWRRATGQLRVDNAQIAPFARLFPGLLAPQGTLNLDATLRPGGNCNGQLSLDGAGTRPLSPLGPLRDVQARIKLDNRRIDVERFTGTLEGEPVSISGGIELSGKNFMKQLPLIDLKLRGQNVALARKPEFVLRSDLDLVISNREKKQVLVSGTLRARESFYLSDLKMLVPGRVATPTRRPPYFSVPLDPFADWRLNVEIRGDKFLKVKTPLFRGELSASLKMEGTLKEPVASGEMTINSGIVKFPFAELRVRQGFITLPSDNPYSPQLFITAESQTFGYGVKMELSGPASEPLAVFSSTPPLSSEQIVLMMTAGELPKDEASFSSEQKIGRLAFFLGKNLLAKLGLGEDSAERLTLRTGENLSQTGKQTYYLEYKLTGDWSIVAEYDRFNALNAGVKWRLYSR